MLGPKIRIDRSLYERLAVAAEKAGYSSVEEFAVHALERAAGDQDERAADAEVEKQLRGLGYVE
jgi:hypothetical protein